MSLLSLKCNTPSAKPKKVSVDTFIDEAELYARGLTTVVKLDRVNAKPCSSSHLDEDVPNFTRCTFTLSEEAKNSLTKLSCSTGIARSRLIRIWLDQMENGELVGDFVNSSVR